MLSWLIREGASIRLAVFGLLVLALVCAAATICESKFGTEVAQRWFYNAPWFLCWLGLLSVNLICATLVRLPWRWKDAGVVASHSGIVLLFAGGMIGHKFGSESIVHLHTPASFQETQMVFAKYTPVIMNRAGSPSGYRISLFPDRSEPRVSVESRPMQREVFPLSSILGKTISLRGDSTQFFFKSYWPDFEMKPTGPTSRSEQPNNPALLVLLTGQDAAPVIEKVHGFCVQLLQFEVIRDDESGTPLDFRSTVRFTDPTTGNTFDSVISMNHPARYPTGFWRMAQGRSYRFLQMQWNPKDLGETTLQVRYDPGWPLKWFGSLALCLGMAGTFLLK